MRIKFYARYDNGMQADMFETMEDAINGAKYDLRNTVGEAEIVNGETGKVVAKVRTVATGYSTTVADEAALDRYAEHLAVVAKRLAAV